METLIFLIILFIAGFFAGSTYAYEKAIMKLKELIEKVEQR